MISTFQYQSQGYLDLIIIEMSSYIIAGSADSIDTAYCEEIARRIKAKYKNIDFRIVIKHASEWEDYLQEICRIYGFLKKSNPIVYTFDGKIIGGKDNFLATATKYFGLDQEQLIVEDLTSKINIKLAEEQLKMKKIQKSNIKTLEEKIDFKYKELLGKGILKYAPKQKQIYLVNGIEYIHLELADLAQQMKFIKQKEIPVINEEIEPEQINLASLTLQDQIKPEETLAKEAFVTANQKAQASEHDRFSEASKSKMHESIASYDKQSKGVKQSGKTKLKIDQQNDDVPDYVDESMKETIVCELADQFFVAFDPKSIIGEEMMFYFNADPSGNSIRMHNDGRPIKGHRVIIREVHYEINEKQNYLPEIPLVQAEDVVQPIEGEQPFIEVIKESKEEQHFRERKLTLQIQKSKTEPNIPAAQSQHNLKAEDALSEANEDLNLISHLNHHTLFIHKPLSLIELKNLIYFIRETNTIATLQFLPENPNPRVKIHVRKLLLREGGPTFTLPVERFISKQLEDKEYKEVMLPSESSEGLMDESGDTFKTIKINGMGFNHIIYQLNGESEEKIHKIIKFAIDHFLSIEEEILRDIGYNLILTKKHIIVVPIVEPYQIYNGGKLYLDGLAFLGYVHTAKLAKPYEIVQPMSGEEDQGNKVKSLLSVQTGFKEEEE